MTWLEIIDRLTRTSEKESVTADNLWTGSKPLDFASCCGVTFSNHVTWRGYWIPCDKGRKAVWTRKKNREAKLRKRHEAIKAAHTPPRGGPWS